ncbi:MAG: hypothetical protein WC584_04220 [Candidatus Pacearchaeota archaeon]
MKDINKIIEYCPGCRQKRAFEYIGNSKYKIRLIGKSKSEVIKTNEKITLGKYSCTKCESIINRGYTIS